MERTSPYVLKSQNKKLHNLCTVLKTSFLKSFVIENLFHNPTVCGVECSIVPCVSECNIQPIDSNCGHSENKHTKQNENTTFFIISLG